MERIVKETQVSLRKNFIYMIAFFVWGFVILLIFLVLAPDLPNADNSAFLTFPYPLENLEKVSETIKIYHDEAFIFTLTFFIATYLVLQSLAIPGPICLSFMAGSIFGRWIGLIIVTFCATFGSAFCYLLYQKFGKGLVIRVFPAFIRKVSEQVLLNKEKLFNFLILLRVMPIVPNWVINFSSPIVGIPFWKFVLATFLGLIVPNFIQISAGIALKDMSQKGTDYYSVAVIVGIVVLAVMPMVCGKKDKIKV